MHKLIAGNEWDLLTTNDQLLIEKRIQRVGFGYREGAIRFAPTFKLNYKTMDENGFQDYKLSRMPSWTDRILYRSNNDVLIQVNYDSNNMVKVSDHRPVFAQFVLSFDKDSPYAMRVLRENVEEAK